MPTNFLQFTKSLPFYAVPKKIREKMERNIFVFVRIYKNVDLFISTNHVQIFIQFFSIYLKKNIRLILFFSVIIWYKCAWYIIRKTNVIEFLILIFSLFNFCSNQTRKKKILFNSHKISVFYWINVHLKILKDGFCTYINKLFETSILTKKNCYFVIEIL